MNTLETGISKLQVDLLAYNTKQTKANATTLRKSLMNVQKETAIVRKAVLTESKLKPKNNKKSKTVQEEEVEKSS